MVLRESEVLEQALIINKESKKSGKKAAKKRPTKKVKAKPVLQELKKLSLLSDDKLSGILNISVKTFRNYRDEKSEVGNNTRIRTKKVLDLYRHGIELFDNSENFNKWMESKNLFLDNQSPIEFMKRDDGIEIIDSQLTNLEYGDNA